MNNFSFVNPTKIIFGEGAIGNLSQVIAPDARIMLCFGGGSVKKSGVYDQVVKALENHYTVEFWGIEPNPDYDTLTQGIALAREHKVDFLLAIGGGSVIDGTKFMSLAIPYTGGDEWQVMEVHKQLTTALPIGTVLTLSATGSEMNERGVLSRRATQQKLAFASPLLYPQFSILDPTVLYTLPQKQLSNGVVDAFMHVMEQYMTRSNQSLVMDRWAEGILHTLVEIGEQVLETPTNYEVISNYMLSATLALNNMIGMGVIQDWATHRIGYELTILYGLDHAETLAVIYPSMLRYLKEQKQERLVQYGERIWGITEGTSAERATLAIDKTEAFFVKMGKKVRMRDYGIPADAPTIIYERLKPRNVVYGEANNIDAEAARTIFEMCY